MIPRRVHEYEFLKFESARFNDNLFQWSVYKCKYCNDTSTLPWHMLINVSPVMAACLEGRKLSLLERIGAYFAGNIDCLADGEMHRFKKELSDK